MGAFKCPKCGSTTGEGDYCLNCGEPLTIECPQCGATWRHYKQYRFCPSCGAKVGKHGVSEGRARPKIEVGRPKLKE